MLVVSQQLEEQLEDEYVNAYEDKRYENTLCHTQAGSAYDSSANGYDVFDL